MLLKMRMRSFISFNLEVFANSTNSFQSDLVVLEWDSLVIYVQ